jgi:hypothetical protein
LSRWLRIENSRDIFTSLSFNGGASNKAFLVDGLRLYVSFGIIVRWPVGEITQSSLRRGIGENFEAAINPILGRLTS